MWYAGWLTTQEDTAFTTDSFANHSAVGFRGLTHVLKRQRQPQHRRQRRRVVQLLHDRQPAAARRTAPVTRRRRRRAAGGGGSEVYGEDRRVDLFGAAAAVVPRGGLAVVAVHKQQRALVPPSRPRLCHQPLIHLRRSTVASRGNSADVPADHSRAGAPGGSVGSLAGTAGALPDGAHAPCHAADAQHQ